MKNLFISLLILTFITGCSISISQSTTQYVGMYKVIQVYPPIYYGTDDFPETEFYVSLLGNNGKFYEKLFVHERCEGDYKNVNVNDKYILSITETKDIFGNIEINTGDLTKQLCPNS